MATLALKSRAGQLEQLSRLLEPFPGRLEFAARVAAICALTALIVEIYQTPDAALTTYVVFFLNKPDRTTSLVLSVAMMLIMTIIIGVVFPLAMVVIDYPSWRVASMTILSFGLLFLASASKLRPVGATVALIAAYALDLLGSVPGGELATRGLLYAWLFVGIPAGVSFVVNLLLAPSPSALCERELARRLRLAAAMLRAPDDETRAEFTKCLREANGEIEKRLRLALMEKSASSGEIEALRRAAASSFEIISLIDVVESDPHAALPSALRGRLSLVLDSLAGKSYAGGSSVKVDFEDAVAGEPPLSPLAVEVVSRMKGAISAFTEADPKSPSQRDGARMTPRASEAKKSSGFFLPDAFTNPDHVRYALKTTAAAMFCYVAYSLLDWPGIHTCFLTCYIVSLETTAETIEKLTLRISGCLIGTAAGYAVDCVPHSLPYVHRRSDYRGVPGSVRVGVGRGRKSANLICWIPDRLRLPFMRHSRREPFIRFSDGEGSHHRRLIWNSGRLSGLRQHLAGERREANRPQDRRHDAADGRVADRGRSTIARLRHVGAPANARRR